MPCGLCLPPLQALLSIWCGRCTLMMPPVSSPPLLAGPPRHLATTTCRAGPRGPDMTADGVAVCSPARAAMASAMRYAVCGYVAMLLLGRVAALLSALGACGGCCAGHSRCCGAARPRAAAAAAASAAERSSKDRAHPISSGSGGNSGGSGGGGGTAATSAAPRRSAYTAVDTTAGPSSSHDDHATSGLATPRSWVGPARTVSVHQIL
jgi:hypothetical protein